MAQIKLTLQTLTLFAFFITTLVSCGGAKKTTQSKYSSMLSDSALTNANIGIAVYDVAESKYIYKHNSDKYFIPASNTKILTCFTAMQLLGAQLPSLSYTETNDTIYIQGYGDPSFLNEEYKTQPVADFFGQNKQKTFVWHTNNWKEDKWGFGWSWTDFGENYCQERSVLPLYYNTVKYTLNSTGMSASPNYFNYLLQGQKPDDHKFVISKNIDENKYNIKPNKNVFKVQSFSFTTDQSTVLAILQRQFSNNFMLRNSAPTTPLSKILYTQNTDSVLKVMMHRSDNFYAEQLLLMCSNKQLGYMNNEAIIAYVKNNLFKGIPQQPRWVDGSGLSRYNMFTPESVVWILQQMKDKFGMERLKAILATGGEGTLSSLYKNISGQIFAKTGTLSNHAALSGYLYTKSGKMLIFSTLTSGYQGSANPTRKAVEKMITELYNQY